MIQETDKATMTMTMMNRLHHHDGGHQDVNRMIAVVIHDVLHLR